jgi:hypothetical protein
VATFPNLAKGRRALSHDPRAHFSILSSLSFAPAESMMRKPFAALCACLSSTLHQHRWGAPAGYGCRSTVSRGQVSKVAGTRGQNSGVGGGGRKASSLLLSVATSELHDRRRAPCRSLPFPSLSRPRARTDHTYPGARSTYPVPDSDEPSLHLYTCLCICRE